MNWMKGLTVNLKKADKVWVCEIMAMSILIIPILWISLYALPASDDFFNSYAMKLSMQESNSFIEVALGKTVGMYKSTGGYFFSIFLNYFFSPFFRGGIKALRGFTFAVNLFFYFSLCFLNVNLLKFCKISNRRAVFLLAILVLFAFTNNYNHSEMLTWYGAVVAYVLVTACMFWGIFFFIKAIQSGKKFYIVMASLIGFLVSGGSLNITALNCMVYLVIGFIAFTVWNRKKTGIICFGCALLGGIINVLAPGNFARHETISSSYSIMGALKTSVFLVWSRLQYLLFYSPFILVIVVFFILTFKYTNYKKEEKKYFNPILILGIVLLGVAVVNFPVCLGYNSGTFPDRCVWVEDCCIYLGIFGWTIYLVNWLKNKYGNEIKIQKETTLCILICGIFFLCNLGAVRELDSYPTVQMIKQLTNGQIAEYAEFWDGVFAEIEATDYGEVVIYRDEIKKNDFIFNPGIDSHIDNWINSAAAHYYDKDWICIMTEKTVE